MTSGLITQIQHGVSGVELEQIPLCPECGQPLWAGGRITLQVVDSGMDGDLLRLVHTDCVEQDEDEQEQHNEN